MGHRHVAAARGPARRAGEGQAALRAARPPAARALDAGEDQKDRDRVAADQGARRAGRPGSRRLHPRLGAERTHARGAAQRYDARCRDRGAAACARRAGAAGPCARCHAHAGQHPCPCVRRSRVGVRVQVRWLSHPGGTRGWARAAALAQWPRSDRPLPGRRARARRAAVRAVRPGWRSGGHGRNRAAELRPAAAARPGPARRGRGAPVTGAAGDVLRVRPARLRPLRRAAAAAARAQGAAARAAAERGDAPLLRSRAGARHEAVRARRADGTGGRGREARRRALPQRPLL